MRRQPVVVLVAVVVAMVVALQVLGAVDPTLAEAIRRELVADAELASALLGPVALVVAITRPGRS